MTRYNFVASGDTYQHKEKLSELGFRWRPKDEVWVRPVPENQLYWNKHIEEKVKEMRGVTLWQEKAR